MSFLIGVIVGSLVSAIFTTVYRRLTRCPGRFLVDTSNLEKDVFRVDIYDLKHITNKKYVELKVVPNATLSQE